jgi:DNA repair protein RAD50
VDRERLKFLKADKDKAERVSGTIAAFCVKLIPVAKMRKDLADQIDKENSFQTKVENLKEEVERLKEINVQLYTEATGFQSIFEKHEGLKSKKAMLDDNRKSILDGMTTMSGMFPELHKLACG